MERTKLLRKLNWFYSLETQQYKMYSKQAARIEDKYIRRVFNQLSEIEREHAYEIKEYIVSLGSEATVLGGVLATITGKTAGELSSLVDPVKLYKFDILLESKAIDDYKDLINRVDREDLKQLLWTNAIEEDLHRGWFESRQKEV
jgi:bacterioferritin